MRPSLFITTGKIAGLRSLAELREAIAHGHAETLWQKVKAKADDESQRDPWLPGDMCPSRDPVQAERKTTARDPMRTKKFFMLSVIKVS